MATTTPRGDLDTATHHGDGPTVTRLERGGPGSMTAALQAVLADDADLLVGKTDDSLSVLDLPEPRRTVDAEMPIGDTCTIDAVVAATPAHDTLVEYRRVLRPNGYLLTSLTAETGYTPLAVAGFEPVLELVVDGGDTLVVLAQAA
ncbi:hypothetical protein [Haloarchaeobius sp. DYHT-AS-18]|uniref:hypothetical protein n=1 Tax=Haloarchaeobius sp. DYHT-AS-18 TaxID=3446117 RepID=UPI003EB934F9